MVERSLHRLPPGRHAVGDGLYLVVSESDARRWSLRVRSKAGKRHELGLGSLRDVAIEEARAMAAELRRAAREGRDPVAERRARPAKGVTFRGAFEAYFVVKRRTLGNAKHLRQWESTMETYVYPKIGERLVAEIRSGEIIEILEPIWHEITETAHRVLQRITVVFDFAIARNWREAASPCVGVAQVLGGTRNRAVRHHPALPYDDVAAFLRTWRAGEAHTETKLCLEFQILTAARPGMATGATWSEIDASRAQWTIPGGRMKGTRRERRDFCVPLSRRCLEILEEARALKRSGDLIFPNPRTGKMFSDSALSSAVRDLGYAGRATPHGFRSSFRDWATERNMAREVVAEAALAHSVRNRTEAAYRRAQYIEERRVLMERWAAFVNSEADPSLRTAGEVDVVRPETADSGERSVPWSG
jgi:integrase